MPYITTYERRGIQQGLRQKGQEDLIDVLTARLELLPETIVDRINQIEDLAVLKQLLLRASVVESLEAFQQFLDEIVVE